jgi:RimJ/RimL family protein N-acetyltransferase
MAALPPSSPLSPGEFTRYRVLFRPIQETDLEMLRQWRNQPEVRENMRDTGLIAAAQQQAWFSRLQHHPGARHFVALYQGQPFGSANLKAAGGHEAAGTQELESGLYIGEAQYRGTFLAFCLALGILDHAFEDLGCCRVRAQVREHNLAALRFNQALGYREICMDGGLVQLALEPDAYQGARTKILRFLR